MVLSLKLVLVALVAGVYGYDGGSYFYKGYKGNNIDILQPPSPEKKAKLMQILQSYRDGEIDCINHPIARKVDFFLYDRNNSDSTILLDTYNLDLIDATKDAKLMIHGWVSAVDMLDLKFAYLKRNSYYDNVILVDWSKYSFQPYAKAYCDVPGIARAVSQFLCTVKRKLGMPLSKFYAVGYNLGGNIADFARDYAEKSCQQYIRRVDKYRFDGGASWLKYYYYYYY